jgi:hypothetical protein
VCCRQRYVVWWQLVVKRIGLQHTIAWGARPNTQALVESGQWYGYVVRLSINSTSACLRLPFLPDKPINKPSLSKNAAPATCVS